MSEPTQVNAEQVAGYEDTIKYSQGIRKQIVQKFIGNGVPDDLDQVKVILTTLKDMDSTTINERKNEIESSNADSSKEVAEAMRELIKLQRNRNPFELTDDDQQREIKPPILDESELGTFDVVPGEDEIGVVVEDAEGFIQRMEKHRQEKMEE